MLELFKDKVFSRKLIVTVGTLLLITYTDIPHEAIYLSMAYVGGQSYVDAKKIDM